MFIPYKPRRVSKRRNAVTGKLKEQVIDPGQRGLGIKHWRSWITEYFLADPQVEVGDLLLADRLSQHKDQRCIEQCKDKGIRLEHFPAGGAAELSQIDNSLVADFRRDLQTRKWSDVKTKKQAIFDTWAAFPSSRIVGYWRKCGYLVRHKVPRQRKSVWSRKDEPTMTPSALLAPKPKRIAKRKRSLSHKGPVVKRARTV
jgi:hypothetical protein